jgi:hypothetical protein
MSTCGRWRDCPSSPLPRRSAFPPVVWWLLQDHRRCNLHGEVVAELQQLLRRPRVLEENLIDVERIQFAGAVAIDSLSDGATSSSSCAWWYSATTERAARRSDLSDTSMRLLSHRARLRHLRADQVGRSRVVGQSQWSGVSGNALPAVRRADPRLGDPHRKGRRFAIALYHVTNRTDDHRRVAHDRDLRIDHLLRNPPEPARVRFNVGGSTKHLPTMGRPHEVLVQPSAQPVRVARRQRLRTPAHRRQHLVPHHG